MHRGQELNKFIKRNRRNTYSDEQLKELI